MTFADAVAPIRVGDRGRSCAPTADRDKFAAERLHLRATRWRSR
jgi:hypothetical protein